MPATKELIFLVEEAAEGGFVARALGESIFTEAAGLDELRMNIHEAVACHFQATERPGILRLRLLREEVLAL